MFSFIHIIIIVLGLKVSIRLLWEYSGTPFFVYHIQVFYIKVFLMKKIATNIIIYLIKYLSNNRYFLSKTSIYCALLVFFF